MLIDASPYSYWDFDDQAPITCAHCGRTGQPYINDDTDAFLDVRCIACDGSLRHIQWPSLEETQAAADAGNQAAQRELPHLHEVEDRRTRATASALVTAEQLPHIDAPHIVIDWDFVEDGDEVWTVLMHQDRELFREHAYWEGIDRFPTVVEILKSAYGSRLRGVRPTSRSLLYLYGDRYSAPQTVATVNEQLAR